MIIWKVSFLLITKEKVKINKRYLPIPGLKTTSVLDFVQEPGGGEASPGGKFYDVN